MTTDVNVLLIAREEQLRTTWRQAYEAEGLRVCCVEDLAQPDVDALQNDVDLIVLEGSIHGYGTMDFCRSSMERSGPPIILVTHAPDLSDHILALEMGADDVLGKPVEPRLLLAKSRALVRRRRPERRQAEQAGVWSVDGMRSEILAPSGHRFKTPPLQIRLMSIFIQNPGRIVTTRDLLPAFDKELAPPATVRTGVSRLRQLLIDHTGIDPICTLRGAGYIFENNVEAGGAPRIQKSLEDR